VFKPSLTVHITVLICHFDCITVFCFYDCYHYHTVRIITLCTHIWTYTRTHSSWLHWFGYHTYIFANVPIHIGTELHVSHSGWRTVSNSMFLNVGQSHVEPMACSLNLRCCCHCSFFIGSCCSSFQTSFVCWLVLSWQLTDCHHHHHNHHHHLVFPSLLPAPADQWFPVFMINAIDYILCWYIKLMACILPLVAHPYARGVRVIGFNP
jgi:hypothetical protein